MLCTGTVFKLWILYVLWGLIWNEMIDMALSLVGPELVGVRDNEHELMEQRSEVNAAENGRSQVFIVDFGCCLNHAGKDQMRLNMTETEIHVIVHI